MLDITNIKRFMNYWEASHNDEASRKNFEKLEPIGRHKWNTARIIEKTIKEDKDC